MDLMARRPVWSELARLYLDTEHDDRELAAMARVLAHSPYSIAELREIELWEVAPVVARNLLTVAGVWEGFDEAWLHQLCEQRALHRGFLLRFAVRLGFRRFVRSATRDYWPRLERLITASRTRTA